MYLPASKCCDISLMLCELRDGLQHATDTRGWTSPPRESDGEWKYSNLSPMGQLSDDVSYRPMARILKDPIQLSPDLASRTASFAALLVPYWMVA